MSYYKGITFANGYNKSFADFKKEFSSTHVFKNIPSAQREEAFKEAHKIATKNKLLKTPKNHSNGNVISTIEEIGEDKRESIN